MGILEQAISGSSFKRKQILLSNSPMSGSTVEFDKSFILLNVSAQAPCRVRLYSDSSSMVSDAGRPTSSFAIGSSIGLVLDTELSASMLSLNFNPPIIGTTFSESKAWYHISSSTAQTITFTSYPIEFSTSAGRTEITVSGSSIPTGSTGLEGNIVSPKSFIILSGSSTAVSRLRLFSRDIAAVPNSEKIRTFGTEPASGSSLIADIAFDTPSISNKFVPILEGYNLTQYSNGSNFVGYMLQNISTTPTTDITASLYIYSIED